MPKPPPPPPPPPDPPLKRNPRHPYPPTRLTRSRTTKSDARERGFLNKRGCTSKSPRLHRLNQDASDDEDAVIADAIAPDESESHNHAPDDTSCEKQNLAPHNKSFSAVDVEMIQVPKSKQSKNELLEDLAATLASHDKPGGDPTLAKHARSVYESVSGSLKPSGNEYEDQFNRWAQERTFNQHLAGYDARNATSDGHIQAESETGPSTGVAQAEVVANHPFSPGNGVDADTIDIGVSGEAGDETISVAREMVGEGDAGSASNSTQSNEDGPAAHDDPVHDFAILGDAVECESFLDGIDISDEGSQSDKSSAGASVKCLKVNDVASPSKDSVASSFQMLHTVYQRPTRPPDLYVLNLTVAIELSYFAHRHDVTGDGNCGYYSIMNVLIRHFRRVCPNHTSLLDELSDVTYAKANWFRLMIWEYVYREFETLLDPSDPVFVDGDGVPMMDFRIAERLREGHQRKTTYDGKHVSSFFVMVDKIYNA